MPRAPNAQALGAGNEPGKVIAYCCPGPATDAQAPTEKEAPGGNKDLVKVPYTPPPTEKIKLYVVPTPEPWPTLGVF